MKNLTHLALAASLSMSAVAVHQSSQDEEKPSMPEPEYMLTLVSLEDEGFSFSIYGNSVAGTLTDGFNVTVDEVTAWMALDTKELVELFDSMNETAEDHTNLLLLTYRNIDLELQEHAFQAHRYMSGSPREKAEMVVEVCQANFIAGVWQQGAQLVHKRNLPGGGTEEIWMK